MTKVIYVILLIYTTFSYAEVPFSDTLAYRSFLENSVNGKPTRPISPEIELTQNEWERSGKFEGDIVLTQQQITDLTTVYAYSGDKNAILNSTLLWPNGQMPYEIASGQFTPSQISMIEKAISEINSVSCVNIRKKSASDTNYIFIQGSAAGCYSYVGVIGGKQVVNYEAGCFVNGIIIHELFHALGFYHMQSTHDRDDWVQIVWAKIVTGKEHNFNKYTSSQVSNLYTEYDYGSVMHYSAYAFSTDGSKTIITLKPTTDTLGQTNGMSQRDIMKLNYLYKCKVQCLTYLKYNYIVGFFKCLSNSMSG